MAVASEPDVRGEAHSGPDFGLPRGRRLTRSGEFQQAYEQGRKVVGRYMVLFLRNGPGAGLRLGVVTSRKVGGAVTRTRARRRLREVYRRVRPSLRADADVVLVARAAVADPSFDDLRAEFEALARRAGILRREGGRP